MLINDTGTAKVLKYGQFYNGAKCEGNSFSDIQRQKKTKQKN